MMTNHHVVWPSLCDSCRERLLAQVEGLADDLPRKSEFFCSHNRAFAICNHRNGRVLSWFVNSPVTWEDLPSIQFYGNLAKRISHAIVPSEKPN